MPIRPENRHRYPACWPAVTFWIKFIRAEGRCECAGECGRLTHPGRCPNIHRQRAYGTGSLVILTVAHLNHTPETWDLLPVDRSILRAMCQGCHLHYDQAHHAATKAARRATELGRMMEPLF
jgi:hypothetical protein